MKKIIILILIFITLPFLFINQSSSNIHDEFEIPTFIDLQNEIINSIDDMDINLTQVDIAYLETLKNNTEVLTLGYVGTEDDSFELYNNNEEYGIYSVIKYLIQKITDINVEYEYVDTFDELKNEVANNKITISPFTSTQSFDNFSSEYYIFEENWYLVYDKNNPKITSNLKVDSNEKLNFIKNSTIGKSDRFINDEFNKLKSLYNIDFTYETSSYPSSVENTMNELIGNPIYDMIPVYDVFELKDFISSPDIDYFTINDLIDVDFSGFGTNIENKQLSNIIYKLLVSNNLIEKYNIFLKNSRHHYIGDKFKESLTQNEKDLLVELSDIGGIDVVTSEQHPSLTIKNNTPSGLVPLITTHLQQLINTIDETNIDFNYKLVTDVDKEMTNNQFSISYNNTPSTTNSE